MPENAQFFAFSREKVRFKKVVKYNLKSAINDDGRSARPPLELLLPEKLCKNTLLTRLRLR
jgi:hypothetical protein